MPMEGTKKRKADNNGAVEDLDDEDLKTLLNTLSKDQVTHLLHDAALRYPDVLEDVRKVADEDPSPRKVFVRGLGRDTKADAIRKVFAQYGEILDVVVVMERKTQKSRGYGFVTFAHAESALLALKEPTKVIEGRTTTCNPAAQGADLVKMNPEDITHRKIYVNNIPEDATFDKLHKFFSQYGEIAEGPIGFQKTGKCKGYTLIVYKTLDGARQALKDPLKTFEGHQVRCKLAEAAPITDATDGKQATAPSGSLAVPGSGTGILGGYAFPYLGYDPSGLSGGVALNPGLSHLLSNPLGQTLKPATNLSALGLGASANSSLSINPSLAALYPTLSSLSSLSSDSPHGLLQGAGHSLHHAGGSLGLASLGAQSGGLAGYPAQLAAYSRLGSASLYDTGTSATSHAAENPTPSVSSYMGAHLGATPAERAQIAGALGRLATYYDR